MTRGFVLESNGGRVKTSKYYDDALSEVRRRGADIAQVLRLLQRAYKRGDPRAAYALATWYLDGKGEFVPRNVAKGVQLLREAVDGNQADAAYDLAVCYETGEGVRKSEKKAVRLYLKAALLGEKQSLNELGRCYWHGLGVKRDRSIARVWFDEAEKFDIHK